MQIVLPLEPDAFHQLHCPAGLRVLILNNAIVSRVGPLCAGGHREPARPRWIASPSAAPMAQDSSLELGSVWFPSMTKE